MRQKNTSLLSKSLLLSVFFLGGCSQIFEGLLPEKSKQPAVAVRTAFCDVPTASTLTHAELAQLIARLPIAPFEQRVRASDNLDQTSQVQTLLASQGLSEPAAALTKAYARVVDAKNQPEQSSVELAKRWQALVTACHDFEASLTQNTSNSVAFQLELASGKATQGPIFSDWMLHQSLTEPLSLYKNLKKTGFNLKSLGDEALGLPALARVSVNNPLDIVLNQRLDVDSIHSSGTSQNVWLLPLALDKSLPGCSKAQHLAPLQHAGVWINKQPALSCYQVSKQSQDTLLPQFRADQIAYQDPKTGLKTPVLRISPLAPLAENTRYLVVLGSGLINEDQTPLVMPKGYLQALIRFGVNNVQMIGYAERLHALAKTAVNLSSSVPVFAASFTTVSPTAEMRRLIAPQSQPQDAVDAQVFAAEAALAAIAPKARSLEIIEGPLSLEDLIRDYLNINVLQNLMASAANPGQSQMDADTLSLLVKDLISNAGLGLPNVAIYLGTIELPYALNDFSQGVTETRLISDRIQAGVKAIKVPFLLVTPGGSAPPAAGWPVTLFQHGVLGDRTNALFPAIAMASMCNNPKGPSALPCAATLAIDLPLHGIAPRLTPYSASNEAATNSVFNFKGLSVPGRMAHLRQLLTDDVNSDPLIFCQTTQRHETDAEAKICKALLKWNDVTERHFGLYQTANRTLKPMDWGFVNHGAARGSSGTLFINPANTMSQRDRLQQAVADLLNLTASLPAFNAKIADYTQTTPQVLDVNSVQFVGHSLGTIVGTQYAWLNQQYAHSTSGQASAHPQLHSVALLTPGGGLSRIMERSSSFRGPLFGGFQQQDILSNWMPGSQGWEDFALGVQTVVDSVDVYTHIDKLGLSPHQGGVDRLFLAEVVGGYYNPITDSLWPADTVIPNRMHNTQIDAFGRSLPSYFGGTEPLLQQLQLGDLNLTAKPSVTSLLTLARAQSAQGGWQTVARFDRGTHLLPVNPFYNPQGLEEDLLDEALPKVIEVLLDSENPKAQAQLTATLQSVLIRNTEPFNQLYGLVLSQF